MSQEIEFSRIEMPCYLDMEVRVLTTRFSKGWFEIKVNIWARRPPTVPSIYEGIGRATEYSAALNLAVRSAVALAEQANHLAPRLG